MKKRLSVLLIALLFLCAFSSMSLAQFYIDNYGNMQYYDNATNGRPSVTHTHTWGGWQVLRPASCQNAGVQERMCTSCGQKETQTIPKTGHSYGSWHVQRQATCQSTGLRVRYCNVCQASQEETIPRSDHEYGSWRTISEADCQHTGLRRRVCVNCGATQDDTIAKSDHKYGRWTVTKEATCTSKGTRTHTCTVCGRSATQSIDMVPHTPGSWNVSKEPTCQHTGTRTAQCTVCGTALKETLKKVDHKFGDWKITKEATDHSKGTRTSACIFNCGKKKTEDFYPDGTLAPDLANDAAEMEDFQNTLALMGYYDGKIDRQYGKQTSSAVKAFQKDNGLKADGIGWPQTRALMGLGKPGQPISEDDSKKYVKLTAVQLTPLKDFYAAGDKITFACTVTNTAKNTKATDMVLHCFEGVKPPANYGKGISDKFTLAAGESQDFTYEYSVTKKDAFAGKFYVGFLANGKLGKNNAKTGKVVFMNAASEDAVASDSPESAGAPPSAALYSLGSGGWTPPTDYALDVSKTLVPGPNNGVYYVKDEPIRFRVLVENNTSKRIKNIQLTDSLFPDLDGNIGSLNAGHSKEFILDYPVTLDDVANTEVVNIAIVSYTGADNKLKTTFAKATAPTGQESDGLFVYKTCTKTPDNGLFFTPGETVDFEIKLVNVSAQPIKDIKVYDSLANKKVFPKKLIKTISQIDPSNTEIITFSTKVTKLHAKKGSLINTVKVIYENPATGEKATGSAICKVPTGLKGQDGVTVTKTVISTPENGSYYQEGEEVRYLIAVKNNTVADIILEVVDSLAPIDPMTLHRTIAYGETVKAGDTFNIHFMYPVDEKDVENTKVTNVAGAYWTIDTDTIYTPSDPVTVPTAPQPKKRKPKRPVEESEKLKEEIEKGDSCQVVLTGLGEGVEWRDVLECTDHSETNEKVRQLLDSASYGEAISAWENDISALYTEWANAADAEGKLLVEDEQAAFERQMQALEGSLALVCDDDKVQTILTEERMYKCYNLCYELHTAPEDRLDRLDGTHEDLPDAGEGEECTYTVSDYETRLTHYVKDQCNSHMQTMDMIQYMLDLAAEGEDKLVAWKRAQGYWTAELDAMYDTWYLSSEEDAQQLIAADRMSFDDLIKAREAALADLYPDDPATAAEVLTNMIMDRTEVICHVLHEAGVLEEEEE